MKLLRLLLTVFAIGFSADSNAIKSLGDRSCGTWIADKKAAGMEEVFDTSWFTGFLTGVAVATGKDALKGIDGNSVALWMDNYCKDHPLAGC